MTIQPKECQETQTKQRSRQLSCGRFYRNNKQPTPNQFAKQESDNLLIDISNKQNYGKSLYSTKDTTLSGRNVKFDTQNIKPKKVRIKKILRKIS
jgi:hypothetical protein